MQAKLSKCWNYSLLLPTLSTPSSSPAHTPSCTLFSWQRSLLLGDFQSAASCLTSNFSSGLCQCSSVSKVPLRGPKKVRLFCKIQHVEQNYNKPKKEIIAITGATGFIGTRLVQTLIAGGHEVRVLTHSFSNASSQFSGSMYPRIVIAREIEWAQNIQGSTSVINLAGPPISTRWNPKVKAEIKNARLEVTRKVVEAINKAPKELRPVVLVSATAVGYYGTSETSTFDETSPSGHDYLSEICREWEATAKKVDSSVRLVLLRTGVVLDKDGGALAKMLPVFKAFAGGPLGSGKQWFSWIHREDLVSLVTEALSNTAYKGIINGTAPNPVRMSEMCNRLAAVLGRPCWLPVPEWALKALLGEGACMVLEGQRVIPMKARELGFEFKYPYIADALKAIVDSESC